MSKVNCKGKRLGEANKGINVEKNNNRFKKLKLRKREKKEENSTELQTPIIEAAVYENNEKIKYVTEEKGEEMLKSLIALLSANNGEGDGTPL